MHSSTTSHPSISTRKKLILWPLWGIPVGCALWIILRNPALGLSVAMFGGTLFLPLNVKMEGSRAKIMMIIAPLVMLSAIVLAVIGNSTLVWVLIGVAALYDIYLSRRR